MQVGCDEDSSKTEDWIHRKDFYAKDQSNDKIVTKVWDPGGRLDTIKGVKEENGDFFEWLKKEIKTEDVEVAYCFPDPDDPEDTMGHIVTILEVYEEEEVNPDTIVARETKTYIKYRDDEEQGNDSKGDTEIKHAEIYKKNGKYHFDSDEVFIFFAVSESKTK